MLRFALVDRMQLVLGGGNMCGVLYRTVLVPTLYTVRYNKGLVGVTVLANTDFI